MDIDQTSKEFNEAVRAFWQGGPPGVLRRLQNVVPARASSRRRMTRPIARAERSCEVSVVHCKKARYDRYVGRAPGERGCFGNPFAIGRDGSREEVIALHRLWLWAEINAGRMTLEELAALAGKVLGCWCAPAPCHGETLAAAAVWAVEVLCGAVPFDRAAAEPPF